MAVNSGLAAPDHSGWVVYYEGPGVVVTNRWVQNDAGRYPVRLLQNIEEVQVRTHQALATAAVTSTVEVALAVPLAVAYHSAGVMCVGLVAAGGMGLGVLVDGRRNPRWMALRAIYQGERVELFQSRDKKQFGHVKRAVLRAVQFDRGFRIGIGDHRP